MDFFDRQDAARKRTKLLVMYFIIAVLATALLTNLIIYWGLLIFSKFNSLEKNYIDWLKSPGSHVVMAFIILFIIGGSILRYLSIRKNCGHNIATMAGATPLAINGWSDQEKIFMNVVEEMAIAAGIPVPSTYIMRNEDSINAFVAGLNTSETALVITKGCLDNLTREELQAVIAHEFSHILNGDMILNVRLFSLLSGILAVSQIGIFLMGTCSWSKNKNKNKNNTQTTKFFFRRSKGHGFQIQAFVIGLGLYCVGYIGLLCGQLIKAAISRQREYLADSSSVQFTRHSDYIAAALYKMSTGRSNSYLHNTSHLEDISHMCFGEVYNFSSSFFSKWLATHPPVSERINAIDPKYLIKVRARARKAALTNPEANTKETSLNLGAIENSAYRFASSDPSVSHFSASAGQITQSGLAYANKLHTQIPSILHSHAHTAMGAQALLFAFLIHSSNKPSSTSQQDHEHSLIAMAPDSLQQTLKVCLNQIKDTSIAIRLPLIEIALSQIKRLSHEDQVSFVKITKNLITADKDYSFFELTLFTLLKQTLRPDTFKNSKIKYKNFEPIQHDIEIIISTVLKSTGETWGRIEDRYHDMMHELGFINCSHFNDLSSEPKVLEKALDKLKQLSPFMKRSILQICEKCITHDGEVTFREAELLRTICAIMDVPMPPLTPDQLTAA